MLVVGVRMSLAVRTDDGRTVRDEEADDVVAVVA